MNSSYVFLLKNTSHHMQKFNMISIWFLWKFTIPTCVHCTTTFYIKHNNLTLNSASNCSKNWIPFVYNLLFSKPLKHFLSGIISNLIPILQLYKNFKDLRNILSIWKVKKRLSCSITESTSADFVKTFVKTLHTILRHISRSGGHALIFPFPAITTQAFLKTLRSFPHCAILLKNKK